MTTIYALPNKSTSTQARLYMNPQTKTDLSEYLTVINNQSSLNKDVATAFEVLSSMIFSLPEKYTVTVRESYLGMSTHGLADWDTKEITLNSTNKYDSPYYLDGREFTLNAVVLIHEILHILGYGVGEKWDTLITTRCSAYHGKNGIIQYKNLLRSRGYNVDNINSVLLENNFGQGTANAHLEEGIDDSFFLESGIMSGVDHPSLVNELMSGFLDGQDVITTVTLGILEDLGARVNYASKFVNNDSKYLVIQSDIPTPILYDSFVIVGHTFTGNDDFRVAISEWFLNKSNATKKYGKIQHWNTINVTDMSRLFMNKHDFNENLLDWDVRNVVSMREMFMGASAFNRDIRIWAVNPSVDTTNMLNNALMMNINPLWNQDPGYGVSPGRKFFENKILGYYRDTAIDIYVSAGELNSMPPYRLYLDPEGKTELPGNMLYIRSTYRFHRLNSATTHPFYVSDQIDFRDLTVIPSSSKLILGGDGSNSRGIVGDETFTLRFAKETDEIMMSTDTLRFYCTSHSYTMYSKFSLSYYNSNLVFMDKDYKSGLIYHPDYINNSYDVIRDYTCYTIPSLTSIFDGVIQIKTSKMTYKEDVRPGTIYLVPTDKTLKNETQEVRIVNTENNEITVTMYTTPLLVPSKYDYSVNSPDTSKETEDGKGESKETIAIEIDTVTKTPATTPAPAPAPAPESEPITEKTSIKKILCLHGGGGSAAGFRQQQGIRDLIASDNLTNYEFTFLNSPYPSGVWYEDPPYGKNIPTVDSSWANRSIIYITNYINNNGPFHGILGYSQGAAMVIVYLAYTNIQFEKVLLFNGYLPSTHQGLMNKIIQESPMNETPLIFLATNDPFYIGGTDIKVQNIFAKDYQVISTQAGHSLPTNDDPTFSNVVEYILTGQTTSSPTIDITTQTDFNTEKEPEPKEEEKPKGYWFDTAYSRMITSLDVNFTIDLGNQTNTKKLSKKTPKKMIMPFNF
jgi:pimeloyl-ACP methyl ester carboxylesterase